MFKKSFALRFALLNFLAALTPILFAAATADFAAFDARARAGERLSVVFFGASLTWGANASDPQQTSYRARVAQRLEAAYPNAHFKFWDAAIGGTGSQLGVFRLDRDVLSRHPDLVFLDFSANDGISSGNVETLASYEAILRRIITEARAPVVQVILPFKWDVEKGSTDGMLRRDAHLALALAYGAGVGDAIELGQARVKSGTATLAQLWPVDGVHPGDAGYEMFADAAWDGFQRAVAEKRVCHAPEKMIYAPTYMTSARVRLATLSPLPEGWRVESPHVVSAYFDMLMSRWLDSEVVVSNAKAGEGGKKSFDATVAPLAVKFTGSMVMLFGESTSKSAKFRARIDGKLVERKASNGKPMPPEFDAGRLGNMMKANAHLVEVIAEGLDPAQEHTLEIEPIFTTDSELEIRLESICVAGGKAEAHLATK